MFYPQEMTEVEIIVPAKDILAVTKTLSGQGVFHQTDGAYLSAEAEAKQPNLWQEKASIYAALERRVQAIAQALGLDEGLPPRQDFDDLLDIAVTQPVVEQLEQAVKQITEQLTFQHKQIEHYESTLRQLKPVADLDIDVSQLRQPRYLFSILGMIPVDNMERLQTSLSRIPYIFLPLSQDNQRAVVWLAGSRNNADVLERAARSAYLNPILLPENYQGKPTEIDKQLREQMDAARQKIVSLQADLAKLRDAKKDALQQLVWEIRASRLLADAVVRYGRLKYTYLVVGWVPTSSIPTLTQRIQQVSKETLIETFPAPRRADKPNVPVALHNPKGLLPFQSLVTTYARPKYDELDPTLLIAITFPLLFGAMFGDVGQGLTLALLGGLLISRKVKALQGLAGLGGLIVACGLSATVFGFLYGSVFGVEHILHALWLQPMENIMQILLVAIGAGMVLLSVGFLIGIFNAWRSRDWGKMLVSNNGLAGLILYWSSIGLVAGAFLKDFPVPSGVFLALAIPAAIVVMLSEVLRHLIDGHRPLIEEGIGTYAIQAFFELFETMISFLSNSLSYVRVGAFAVAHAGLSAVIFILAELASPHKGIGYWVVVTLGNLFIVGFEGLIVGIQTMRLEYYEFFSKFFTGGGMRYEPLNLRPAVEK